MDEAMTTQQHEEQPRAAYPIQRSAAFASGTFLAAMPFEIFGHFGPTGLLVSGLASYVAWRHGPELADMARQTFHFPAPQQEAAITPGRTWLDRAIGWKGEEENQATQPGEASADALFQAAQQQERASETPSVPRLQCNDIARNTPLNSYQICIGRSLTRPGHPPVFINFAGQHFKFIGASQFGKSSMAAAFLYLVSRTHDENHVLFALLDKEHKTSKLFADIPQLAEYTRSDGKCIPLHAKNDHQVLEYLGYLVEVMEDRYIHMTELEVEQQPILLVYLEEFLSLKNSFKNLMDAAKDKDTKAQAAKDYADLVYRVSELARRGLKVKIQLLLCAQVDYRDEDLQEALINVSCGMSFSVRVTAAQAAGFYNAELLKRNVLENKKGQAVVETPDCNDLILAPEYNLKEKLLAFARKQAAAGIATPARASNLKAANGVYAEENEKQAINAPINSPVNADAALPREVITDPLINAVAASSPHAQSTERAPVNEEIRKQLRRLHTKYPHRELCQIVGLSGPKYDLYKQVCAEEGIVIDGK